MKKKNKKRLEKRKKCGIIIRHSQEGKWQKPREATSALKNRGQKNKYRGVEQLVARRAHNPEVAGSSPVPATMVGYQNR